MHNYHFVLGRGYFEPPCMYSVMLCSTLLWLCLLIASQMVDVKCCRVKTFTVCVVINHVIYVTYFKV